MIMAELGKLKVEEFPDFLGNDVFHFMVSKNDSLKERGFGSARSEKVALMKAYSEYCERTAMLEHSQAATSNGFAAHRTFEQASFSAQAELIERDLVICSWLCRRPPLWLNLDSLGAKADLFSNVGMTFRVGLLGHVANTVVLCSLLFPNDRKKFGCLFASAAGKNISEAIETLYLNQRRNLTYAMAFLSEQRPFISEQEVKTPDDHRIYYLNPANNSKWDWYLNQGQPFFAEKVEIKSIPIKFNIQTPWPIYVCRAVSPSLQQYFVGNPIEQNLNFQRLSEYEGQNVSAVNNLIHLLA